MAPIVLRVLPKWKKAPFINLIDGWIGNHGSHSLSLPLSLSLSLSLSHAWMGLTLAEEEAQGNDSSIPPTLAKFASVRAATGPAERKGERGAVPSPPIQRCIADCANLVHKSFSFHLSTCDRCNFLWSSLLYPSPHPTVLNKARYVNVDRKVPTVNGVA